MATAGSMPTGVIATTCSETTTSTRVLPKHEVRLPAPAVCTNAEKVYIEEREGYLAFGSITPEQKQRKLDNLNWLVNRRKQLYRLIKEDKTEGRQRRYEALCIATSHGSYYKEWDKKHNKWGVPLTPPKPVEDPNSRAGIVRWCNKYVGVKENPAGSNAGEPQPSGWERRVYGGTRIPWCACFSVCSAWDAGIKGSGTASVQLNVNLARKGQGIYRGYTTDPSRVRPGDHCAVGSTSTHTEVVVDAALRLHRRQHRPEQRGQRWHGHEHPAPGQHRRLDVDSRAVAANLRRMRRTDRHHPKLHRVIETLRQVSRHDTGREGIGRTARPGGDRPGEGARGPGGGGTGRGGGDHREHRP